MLPKDLAAWDLANEIRNLIRPEEAYACAEKHLNRARRKGLEAATKLLREGEPCNDQDAWADDIEALAEKPSFGCEQEQKAFGGIVLGAEHALRKIANSTDLTTKSRLREIARDALRPGWFENGGWGTHPDELPDPEELRLINEEIG